MQAKATKEIISGLTFHLLFLIQEYATNSDSGAVQKIKSNYSLKVPLTPSRNQTWGFLDLIPLAGYGTSAA